MPSENVNTAGATEPTDSGERERLVRRDWVTAVVLALVLVALGLRVFDLGLRVAHWQEGRLGWWIQRYARTGVYDGTPALGGSLLRLLGRVAVDAVGATDLAIRAPVALAGGLLPLTALCLRRRLADREVVFLAGLLALAPLLLYYTRFASVDALTAVLALSTVAAVVAFRDTARPELAVAVVVLGVLTVAADPTTALGHLLALLVAWGVVLVLLPSPADDPAAEESGAISTVMPAALADAWRTAAPAAVAVGLLLGVVLLDPSVPGHLRSVLGSPAGVLEVVLGPIAALGAHLTHVGQELVSPPGLVESAGALLGTLGGAAPVVTGMAVVGGLAERWADRPVRPLVAVAVTWAVLGVPLQLLFAGAGHPWVGTHVLVALVVPAAVGVNATVRWTRGALAAGDPLTGAAGSLAIVLAAGLLAATVVSGSFLAPTAPAAAPVQYGQPAQDLRPAVDALEDHAVGVGPDLVLFGHHFVEGEAAGLDPPCARWYNALPLPWYATASGATTACTTNASELRDRLAQSPVLVVGREGAVADAGVDPATYTRLTARFRARNANVTVFVRSDG